jgi:hypothetical protein
LLCWEGPKNSLQERKLFFLAIMYYNLFIWVGQSQIFNKFILCLDKICYVLIMGGLEVHCAYTLTTIFKIPLYARLVRILSTHYPEHTGKLLDM